MKVSLARAIAGGAIIASLISVVAISGYSYYSSRQALVANARIIMEAHARNVEQQTRLLLEPVPILAAAIIDLTRRTSNPLNQEHVSYRFLVEKLKDLPNIYSVYWADSTGQFFLVGRRPLPEAPHQTGFFLRTIRLEQGRRQVTETWFTPDGAQATSVKHLADDEYDPRVRPWYLLVAGQKDAAWSEPYVFYITRKPGITYAVPIHREGALAAVCAVDLETESLSHYLKQILPTERSRIFVVNASQHIIGFSDPAKNVATQETAGNDDLTLKRFDDKLAVTFARLRGREDSEGAFDTVQLGGETFHAQFKSLAIQGLPLSIGLMIPDGELFAPLVQSQWTIMLFSVAIITGLTLAGMVCARAVAQPMEKLRKAAMRISERRFDESLAVQTHFVEIDITFAAFRQMQESMREYLENTHRLNESLKGAHLESLYRLAMAAEYKDRDTATHLSRVSHYSREIARLHGAAEEDAEALFHASLMHDVGKIGVPDALLTKTGRYSDEERKVMEQHTMIGAKLLSEPTSQVMKLAQVIALSHHEKWDGTGYPAQLAGNSIPLWGRIVALADVMDALLSRRPYKEALEFDQVLDYLRDSSGGHFEPALVELVLSHAEAFREITLRFTTASVPDLACVDVPPDRFPSVPDMQ